MTSQPKFKYHTHSDGIKLVTCNGKPLALVEKAPLELRETYPNVIAVGFVHAVNPMTGLIDELTMAILSAAPLSPERPA